MNWDDSEGGTGKASAMVATLSNGSTASCAAAVDEYRQFLQIQPMAAIGEELEEQMDEWESMGLIVAVENSESEE